MIFVGKGLVRWKGRPLANFIDKDGDGVDEFETSDEKTIRRLQQLGYQEKVAPPATATPEAQPQATAEATPEPAVPPPSPGKKTARTSKKTGGKKK